MLHRGEQILKFTQMGYAIHQRNQNLHCSQLPKQNSKVKMYKKINLNHQKYQKLFLTNFGKF